MLQTSDPGVLDEYTDLLMLQTRGRGVSYEEIASVFSISSSTEVEERINAMASECIRAAMAATRGNPEHPQPGLFKLEEFTADPRWCMQVIVERRLNAIEKRYKKK